MGWPMANAISQIIECSTIKDLLSHADEQTLVMFDMDNTLIESASYLGGIGWFNYHMKIFMDRGLDEAAAADKVYPLWRELQNVIKVKPVEDIAPKVIRDLQARNIKMMGLTGRSPEIAHKTNEQLASINIFFDQTSIYQKDLSLGSSASFIGGTLFVDSMDNKGAALERFLTTINYTPQKLVFIDDIKRYLESVQRAVVWRNVPFIGLRYSATDNRVATFNPARAAEEFEVAVRGTKYQNLLNSI